MKTLEILKTEVSLAWKNNDIKLWNQLRKKLEKLSSK